MFYFVLLCISIVKLYTTIMNKSRRKQITKISETIKDSLEQLQFLQEEEMEYFDEMPENLQGSERGEKSQQCADELQNIIDEIESQLEEIETAIE